MVACIHGHVYLILTYMYTCLYRSLSSTPRARRCPLEATGRYAWVYYMLCIVYVGFIGR